MDGAAVLAAAALMAAALAALSGLGLVGRLHAWYYERGLDKEVRRGLPPGDMGWPFLGNMISFLIAFKSGRPDSFIGQYVHRFGRTGMYKSFMFGSPTVLVTTPEGCREVLMDDKNFVPGWPTATVQLIGPKSFVAISPERHRRLRRLTAAPINGTEALSSYLKFIDQAAARSLDRWAAMGEIEFLTELRRFTFRIIMHIFLSSAVDSVIDSLEKVYSDLNLGMRAMAINIPGFAYHRALKARKKLVSTLQEFLREKRAVACDLSPGKKDMMSALIEEEDEDGKKLEDDEIIDVLIMYLNAGHESSGHIAMWATVLLHKHPECLQKAREEQQEIRRSMPLGQTSLTLADYRKMDYLSKVIDETLRVVNISFVSFRQAMADMKVNGFMIPKGWKVQLWYRTVHMDEEIYPRPKVFDPSRWEGLIPKPGSFVPFGGGVRLCPGNDLAKLEISVFLHHFLLNYELNRLNPNCPVRYLPHPKPIDNCRARILKLQFPAKSVAFS
ncbi:ent-kaurenoic acid oxidase-like [Wolffia australiana]